MSYLDTLPPDIRHLLQTYAEREIMLEVTGGSFLHNTIIYVISVSCGTSTWRLPFADKRYDSNLVKFISGKSLMLSNNRDSPCIKWTREQSAKTLVVVDSLRVFNFTMYTFTDRQAEILIKKLTRMCQDEVAGTLEKIY